MPSIDAPLLNARPRLRIDGANKNELMDAVLAMDVRLPRSGMGSAELRVLNWSGMDFVFLDVRLGQRIELFLSESATRPIFAGDITAIEERYGDGAPQLVLLAEDALHKLARNRQTQVFENMSIDSVVRQIASGAGLSANVQAGTASATWLQNNESDLAFLLRLLTPLDVGLRIQDGSLRVRDEEADPAPVRLAPGALAEHIRIIADLNRQPSTVTVKGYDLESAADTQSSSSSLSPSPAGSTAARYLGSNSWRTEAVFPHPFARSQDEAQALARKRFQQAARRFLYGEIVCRDTPDLSAGREVELFDVSRRIAGRYLVVECRHLFDSDLGLRTHLRVQRPDWNA